MAGAESELLLPAIRQFTSNNSNTTSGNLTAGIFIYPGVQTQPDGCLTLYGEFLTPLAVSVASAVAMQTSLAILAILMDPRRFIFFSLFSFRITWTSVVLLGIQVAHFCYICYTVTSLPPAYSPFNGWDTYSLLYIRLYNSGFIGNLIAIFSTVGIYDGIRQFIETRINDASIIRWGGPATLTTGKNGNPGRSTEYDAVVPDEGVGNASDTNVLLASSYQHGGVPSIKHEFSTLRFGTTQHSVHKAQSCCSYRSRNYVDRAVYEAYWRDEDVGIENEFNIWRQWAFGVDDDLDMNRMTDTKVMAALVCLTFLSVFIIFPGFLTHTLPMAMFFMDVLCVILFAYAIVSFSGKRLRGYVMTQVATAFGPDPRVVPLQSKCRSALWSITLLLGFSMLCFLFEFSFVLFFHHGVIYYSDTSAGYFDVTRIWWNLLDLRCYLRGTLGGVSSTLADFSSVFERRVTSLISYFM